MEKSGRRWSALIAMIGVGLIALTTGGCTRSAQAGYVGPGVVRHAPARTVVTRWRGDFRSGVRFGARDGGVRLTLTFADDCRVLPRCPAPRWDRGCGRGFRKGRSLRKGRELRRGRGCGGKRGKGRRRGGRRHR